MLRAVISRLASGLALIALAGCAAHHPPAPPPASHASAAPGIGIYKVGSPYQIAGTWYYPAEDFSYDETGIASWYGEDFHGKYTANGEIFDLNALSAAHRTLPMPSIVEVTNLENGRRLELRVNDRGPYARGRIIDVSRRAAQLLGFEAQGTAKVRVRILVPESIAAASLARRNSGQDQRVAAALPAQPREPVASEALPAPLASPAVATAAAPVGQGATVPALPASVTVVPVKPTQIYIQAGAYARADNAMRVKSRLEPLGRVAVSGARVKGVALYRVRLGPIGSVDEADRLLERVVDRGLAEARIVVD